MLPDGGRRVSFSARWPSSYRDSSGQGVAIIPGHPFLRAGGQFPGMALEFDQIVEGVCAAQLAGVDKAHEKVSDFSAIQRAIVESVLAMQNRSLQGSFYDVVIQRGPGLAKEQ